MPKHSMRSVQNSSLAKSRHSLGKIIIMFGVATIAMGTTSSSKAAIPYLERLSLESLYGNTNGPNWTNNLNNDQPWFGTQDACTFKGITCGPVEEGFQHVTGIYLPYNNLVGTGASVYLGYLTELRYLDLSENQLTAFPSLRDLPALQYLNVSNNPLTSFPALTELPALQELYVNDTPLTVFPVLTGLLKLQVLYAYNNKLSAFPPLQDLPALQYLDISSNQLIAFPVLTGLPALRALDISSNQLTSFPTLTDLTALRALDVSDNQLTSLPDLSGLSALQALDVSQNQLTSFPVLTGLSNLVDLHAGSNHIHGPVPPAPATLNRTNIFFDTDICPNPMDLSPSANDAGWDIATHATFPNHWWNPGGPGTGCDLIFKNDFEHHGSPFPHL